MAICDKINTAGQTLQSNLNARGVSCTYGKNSENKQTLKDMADLITASNLKGSNDALISISASRPYLLSGEKTDLIVRLVDGLGQPLANKSVSISDGTSVYSGITNNLGLFTLYDMNSGTYTATYSGQSSSCTVYGGAVFYDNATSQSKNTHWKIRSSDQSDLTATVGTGGTTLTSASTSTSRFYFANPDDSTSDSPPITISDFVVEADIFDSSFTDSDSQIAFLLQGQTTSLNLKSYTAPYHIKIEKEGTSAKHYLNDTLIRTTTISSRSTYYMGFQLYKRTSITFRDYVIREI